MKNHRKRVRPPAGKSQPPPQGGADISTAPRSRFRGRKLWLFRLLAIVIMPAVFVGVLELALRIAGVGYPTAFLLPSAYNGKDLFIQNNQFGWRFFGPELSRSPNPIAILKRKPANTVRIFVLGESAAKGDPSPRFGLPRMLEAILSLRHPGVRFEVVNAAVTAINSHAVLPIARDCGGADGDIWVVYMGNNEVVGPFGAGTIFGQQTPPLPMIRSALAVKTTRVGQLLDSTLQMLRAAPTEGSDWGGMKMFLDQQVRADDPRMRNVYHHFKRNLEDIIRAGQNNGVGIVISTVAVNLKDCAPLGSLHRSDLSKSDGLKWTTLYEAGIKAQNAGNTNEAQGRFDEAAKIDGSFAELRFRQAQCALALGRDTEAQKHFLAARDLDTLRFRCDGELNELTRQTAAGREGERIFLADAEKTFAGQSANGLPGDALFYEHVHLNFDGNYLLAKTIGNQIERMLPELLASRDDSKNWPSESDCARRLAWSDWNRLAVLQNVIARVKEPPFVGQFNHESQIQTLGMEIKRLTAKVQVDGVTEARQICETALGADPDDVWLHSQMMSLKQAAGDLAGAAMSARESLELLPSNAEGWSQLGLILMRQQQFDEATAAFQKSFELDMRDVWSLQNLGQSLWAAGRRERAIQEYKRALHIRPDFGLAWVGMGQIYEEMGRTAEAKDCFGHAFSTRSRKVSEVLALAHFCESRSWLEQAATNYGRAIQLDPNDATLYVEAGRNLVTLGRFDEGARLYADAVQLSPESAEARLLHGLALVRKGMINAAAEQFQEAVKIDPKMVDARFNLGIALIKQGQPAEALAQLQKVVEQSPTNTAALKCVELLRAKLSAE